MAGVYDIKEHYQHEASRAIEHYSTMSRAMYDDENNFDNFSPLRILKNIPTNIKLVPFFTQLEILMIEQNLSNPSNRSFVTRLPTFHLMHGSVDATVRPGSSISFAEALWQRGSGDASTSVFVDCNHVDICLDLMDEERRWYGAVMNELKKAFQDFSKWSGRKLATGGCRSFASEARTACILCVYLSLSWIWISHLFRRPFVFMTIDCC